MVAEAVAEERASSSAQRSSKRRKLHEEPSSRIELDIDLFGSQAGPAGLDTKETANDEVSSKLPQIIYDDFEGSDASDVEFEDVELEPAAAEDIENEQAGPKSLELDLSTSLETPRRVVRRRKPVGPAERKLRLEVHKAHLVMLLAHLNCRNRWCESESVHAILKPLVPRKVISLLHVDESKPQYQRSHSFMKGIEEICTLWKLQWSVTARGMHRAHWREDVNAAKESEDAEDLIDFVDFKTMAATQNGSRDLGAQLFCALLRSIAVDARLVCSLQVLPFSGVAKGRTPEKPKPQYYHAPPQTYSSTSQNNTITRPERNSPPKKKRIVESPFPVFWVEVFSPSASKWIPLDPLVRNTIDKPKTGFEPPASDPLNSMTYVIAFEDDGSAKDVTRRYTQWYNAKTRKQRVESTKGGERWWAKTMETFRKPFTEVRDEIEDANLMKRAETEAMPRNIQEFKGHPVYVLERHLRMNEVIHPKHEVGQVSAGVGENAKLENVFRRRDVHLCRTADAWYRRGRDINEGEQPLKRFVPKRKVGRDNLVADEFELEEEANEGTALYAEYQTCLYEPPPAIDGRIPKNAYGNIDVYVPSMIPGGAVHVRHPLASEAARVLGIDYADAVTGFEFKGRQGTAVVDGVVVSMTMCNAMITVIEGLETQATNEVEEARSRVVLSMWKRWLTALRVRERVHQQYGDREEGDMSKQVGTDDEDEDATYREDKEEDYGGGFMLEEAEPGKPSTEAANDFRPSLPDVKSLDQLLPPEVVRQEIIVVRSPNKLPKASSPNMSTSLEMEHVDSTAAFEGGGFISEHDEDNEGGGFIPENDNTQDPSPAEEQHASTKGEAIYAEGGGFLPEDEEPLPISANNIDLAIETTPLDTGGGVVPETTAESPDAPPYHDQASSSTSRPAADNAPAPRGDTKSNLRSNVANILPATSQPDTHSERVNQQSIEPESGVDVSADPAPAPTPAAEPSSGAGSPTSSTSLLSHDPDEEDAEPEWLLNSLGEMD